MRFDALLLLSFGGPDGPDDVRPFLANVLRGRRVPPERVEQVAAQYMLFGGASPINSQNRALLDRLRSRLDVPVYWGNRNWHPYLRDALVEMERDGVREAAVFVTSAYSSYSGCRQYLEDLSAAADATGTRVRLTKLRPFYNHPGFVEPLAQGLADACRGADPGAPVLMSAHSIPAEMAANCDYANQLAEVVSLVADRAALDRQRCRLVFQSRSGPPSQPWLGPDIVEVIAGLRSTRELVVTPIGFVSDHMEVVYDLDTRAAAAAAERGIRFTRTPTPGTHPAFVEMVADLVAELEIPERPARYLGNSGARITPCRPGCCAGPSPLDSLR